jgi:hypothetical protein
VSTATQTHVFNAAMAELARVLNCPDVTVNGYHLPTIARLARDLDSPITGDVAAKVWNLSTSSALPAPVAERFMAAAGYEAFKGYPLQRVRQ